MMIKCFSIIINDDQDALATWLTMLRGLFGTLGSVVR